MNAIKNKMKDIDCGDIIRMEYLQYVTTSYENNYENNIKVFFKELKDK